MDPIRECRCLTRRNFLTSAAGGIGAAALYSLLREEPALAAMGQVPGVPQFAPKAKNCIFIYMAGAPSQFDLFSSKPKLNEIDGQRPPAGTLDGARFAFINKDTVTLMGTKRTFKPYGQS